MTLLVLDLTGVPVKDAIVNINLEDNLVASNVKTDVNGHVEVPASVNGNYQVTVAKTGYMAADGYVAQSMPIEVNCNPDHCQLCTPSASVTLNQEFCQDKVMRMIVKDSLKNEPVIGAQVKVSIDTFEGAKEISSEVI